MASKLPENIVIFFLFNHSVAKKKSLFDDRPMEIQELTYIIKQVQTGSCFFLIIMIITAVLCLVAYGQHQQSFSALT